MLEYQFIIGVLEHREKFQPNWHKLCFVIICDNFQVFVEDGCNERSQWQGGWDPIRELQREVGRLFDSLDPFQPLRNVRQYPPVNVYDAGEGYILSAQLPGVAAEEVELTIAGETLTMRGERKRPEGVKDDSYRRQERPVGRWSRTITLPDRVDSYSGFGQFYEWYSDGQLAQSRECPASTYHSEHGRLNSARQFGTIHPRGALIMKSNRPSIRVTVGHQQPQPAAPGAFAESSPELDQVHTPRRSISTKTRTG